MSMNNILEEAIKAGACEEHGLELIRKAKNIDELINILKTPQGIEFCMKNDFPSKDLLKQYKLELRKHNILIEGVNHLKNPQLVILFGGRVHINNEGYNVCEIHAKDNSIIDLVGKGYSITSLDLYESAQFRTKLLSDSDVSKAKIIVNDYRLVNHV